MEQAARITSAAKNAGEKPAFLCSGDIYAGYIILNLQKKASLPEWIMESWGLTVLI